MSVLTNFVLVGAIHADPGGVIHVAYKLTGAPFNGSIAISCQAPYAINPAQIAVQGQSGTAALTITGPSHAIVAVTGHLGQSHGFAVIV